MDFDPRDSDDARDPRDVRDRDTRDRDDDDALTLGRGPSSHCHDERRDRDDEPRDTRERHDHRDRYDARWPDRDRDPRDRGTDPRDVFTRDLDLPRGREREYRLRGSESRTLATVGAFRVVAARDLRDHADRPIGIDPTGHLVLVYLATVPWTDDFRTFLLGHTALLGVTPSWTLRLVFPQTLHRAYPDYETVVHEELESPLHAETIYDLKRYFFHRRRGTGPMTVPETLGAFLRRCAEVFSGPRFALLYRRWLTDEDAALASVSPTIPEALASGRARVECVVLPHTYQHLSPLVSRRRSRRRRVEEGDQRGDQTSPQP